MSTTHSVLLDENNVVTNVAVGNIDGWRAIQRGECGIGWTWDGAAWSPPVIDLSVRAAGIVLSAAVFWPAVGDALSLTAAQRPSKGYVQTLIVASARLTTAQKELAIDLLEAPNFARADDAAPLLETIAMDLGFGAASLGASPTEAERLAAAQGALDQLFDIANGGTGT